MDFPQTIVAVVIVGVSLATLAGCTATPAPNTDWSDRMIAVLSDSNGQGGAGGDLKVESGTKSARGTAHLADIPSGEYDVLAVCTGTGTVHLAVKTTAPPRRVLASSDIACSATLRLPVTVAATGVALEATDTGASAQRQAVIVTPGWEPAPTTYSHRPQSTEPSFCVTLRWLTETWTTSHPGAWVCCSWLFP
ncbi:MAG: hypothetical protein H7288_09080 [Kineosporiaceae bacterium]|nr:hypothetical protein [Aeromicrobium sp.]